MAWTRVTTGKGVKRSDFGYVSNPGWARIVDELDLRHKREVKDDARIFGPSDWKYGVAID